MTLFRSTFSPNLISNKLIIQLKNAEVLILDKPGYDEVPDAIKALERSELSVMCLLLESTLFIFLNVLTLFLK